jgi:hypothetical protein
VIRDLPSCCGASDCENVDGMGAGSCRRADVNSLRVGDHEVESVDSYETFRDETIDGATRDRNSICAERRGATMRPTRLNA